MSRSRCRSVRIYLRCLTFIWLLVIPAAWPRFFDLPPLPEPEAYGNVVIDRLSSSEGSKPVVFSHWTHRTRYSCRVCHLELDFAMVTNGSEITERANRSGFFCGACHDGEVAFDHGEEHCGRCHVDDLRKHEKNLRKRLKTLKNLPRAEFGNRIDWVAAEDMGLAVPIASLFEPDFEPIPFEDEFEVEAAWSMVPPAEFSHNSHLRWLDCASCHPDLFSIEQEGTENLLMKYILEGKYCGACHRTVAFPIEDCKRCHTKMKH